MKFIEEVWQQIVDDWKGLRYVCRGDDECFDFAVIGRAESIAENWDGSSSLRTYVFNTARRYAYKFFVTRPAYQIAHGIFAHQMPAEFDCASNPQQDYAEDMLAALDPQDAALLREYALEDKCMNGESIRWARIRARVRWTLR